LPVVANNESVPVRAFDDQTFALLAPARTSVRKLGRHETIISSTGGSSLVLIRQGWAARIDNDAQERRLIIDLLLPGDWCGLEALASGQMTHVIQALTPVEVERFDVEAVKELTADRPRLASALLYQSLRQTAAARTNQTRMLKRGATDRLADLICSLASRLTSATLPTTAEIPLTQFDLADATGLSAIHVNRALRELREKRVITVDRRMLRVIDLGALHMITGARR
jgi:CRP-like cAMP-binding protein